MHPVTWHSHSVHFPSNESTGASIGYQLASIIAGGPAPLIAAALFAAYRSWVAIAVYISVCAMISVVAAALMRDYTGQDISEEYVFGED